MSDTIRLYNKMMSKRTKDDRVDHFDIILVSALRLGGELMREAVLKPILSNFQHAIFWSLWVVLTCANLHEGNAFLYFVSGVLLGQMGFMAIHDVWRR